MTQDVSLYAALPYAVEVVPDGTTDGNTCYLARHPELPGCLAHGASTEEALSNLAEARELYLQSLLEDGIDPPRPSGVSARGGPFAAVWTIVPPPAQPFRAGGSVLDTRGISMFAPV